MSRALVLGSERSGGGPRDLRQGNLSQILRYVRDFGPSSRHDIAQACGLGISSLTDLLGELRARRLVRELDPVPRPGAGRPTRPIALDGEIWCVFGVQLDLMGIGVIATTVGGRELWRAQVPCQLQASGPERGPALLQEVLAGELQRIPPDLTLVAVHLAMPGYPAPDGATVTRRRPLGWNGVDLRAVVGETVAAAGLPAVAVALEHDAHLAAIQAIRAELPAPVPRTAVYLGGWRELAGGVVLDGHIFRGSDGEAGDLAHLPVSLDGPACRCGRQGCLESLLGPEKLLVGSGLLGPVEAAALLATEPFGVPELLRAAAAAGHSGVRQALAEGGAALDVAIDGIVCTLDPDVVVLGGFLGPLHQALRDHQPAGHVRIGAVPRHKVALPFSPPGRVLLGAAVSARDACLANPLALTTVV